MARRIHVRPELSVDALERRYRAAREPHECSWCQILWLLACGQIAKRYNAAGAAGMHTRWYSHSHRAAPILSPEQIATPPWTALAVAVHGHAPVGGARTGRLVAEWMSRTLGRPVSAQVDWVYMVRLEGKWHTPRIYHVLADVERQLEWL